MTPSVSIIIAAYNARDFLHCAVESALAQAIAGVEIIVVDDASTDDTLAVAQALAAANATVRVVPLAVNGGPSVARNAGLDTAQGDWVAVLDADDRLKPDHLETLIDAAHGQSADIVLGNFMFFDPTTETLTDSGLTREASAGPVAAACYVEHARPLTGEADWGLLKPLFRRAFLIETAIRYPEHSRHGEDFLIVLDALLGRARVIVSHPATYLYTERSSGWSRTRIDYGGQIRQAKMLLEDRRVASDPDLVTALGNRMDALGRWQGKLEVEQDREAGRYWHLLAAAVLRQPVRNELMRLARAKFFRRAE